MTVSCVAAAARTLTAEWVGVRGAFIVMSLEWLREYDSRAFHLAAALALKVRYILAAELTGVAK